MIKTDFTPPLADLILHLSCLGIEEVNGKKQASAKAKLIYQPIEGSPEVESQSYRFTVPIGSIEADDLRWYLERWAVWPSEHFKMRADKLEANLPEWGALLYAELAHNASRAVLDAWESTVVNPDIPSRFTLLVSTSSEKSCDTEKEKVNESASQLLGLPWELLHNGSTYLFANGQGVRVRRRLAGQKTEAKLSSDPPIRILMVSPRPKDEYTSYIDHRVSARPMVEALAPLGELVRLDILTPPTFESMKEALKSAYSEGEPYHVVHFDGHGIYDVQRGVGCLCFEAAEDLYKVEERQSCRIDASEITSTLTDYNVPLFFLEACQSAKSEQDPTSSVAGRLLQGGVLSVVAMSHSVLVETTRRFVAAFYGALMSGGSVGQAMLAGQRKLFEDTFRFKGFSSDIHLQDWFVPVLFQNNIDPQLIHCVPAERVQAEVSEQNRLALGALPEPPPHSFIGRSRELLMAERLLDKEKYVVLRGEGGEGKTALAVELARWLVASGRFKQAIFASVEHHSGARALLWAVGPQVIDNFELEASKDEEQVLRLVQNQLEKQNTLIVIDNMESVLNPPFEQERSDKKILNLCQELNKASASRLIFTSRELLPSPYEKFLIHIDRLERREAIELVSKVLGEDKLMPHTDGSGESEEEIEKLVDAVQCHARSLVLLAREVAESGVRNATEHLHALMAILHERYPDDRERSLFASVELSLQRLPNELRERLEPLGLFHGGGRLVDIAQVLKLNIEKNEHIELAEQLAQVGLADIADYSYLRLKPAIISVLQLKMEQQLDETQQHEAKQRWSRAISEFTFSLHKQQSQDGKLVTTLTLLQQFPPITETHINQPLGEHS